jgi:RNA polymerase sigma-70 factor (ECF subfamily)
MADRPSETASGRAGRLYDEFGAGLYRYAVILLADAGAAEDAIQQVFAALLRNAGPIENEAHYLRRAVRNECYSMLRGRTRRGKEVARPLLEPVATEGVDHAERLALEAAMRELPVEQREVVHLHVFEGWTFQEVADGCGESINTVASRYRYALARLRETLTPLS